MPYTLNGIGTHYYGAGNRSARVDTCANCNRSATLSSYDTREWFCVIFIPIIPLRKFRILDDCSSCRRHHRMPLADFNERMNAQIQPLRDAAFASTSDPQPTITLVQALIGWDMRAEAQKELDAGLQRFPRDIELAVLAGQLATDRGDWNGALPHYERAYAIDSQHAAAAYGYGWLLHQLGRDDAAVPVLQRAVGQSYNRNGALYLLGTSYFRLSRWNDALQTYQQLLGENPQYASDKKFMRLIVECKRRLGYELNDVERRAGRSWWPFGGSPKARKPPKLQGASTVVRPTILIAGVILLVVMAGALAFTAVDGMRNTDVYFDNALGRVTQLDVDGEREFIGANAHLAKSLSNGAHTVVIREADGTKEIERMTINVQRGSFFDAFGHERFYVYNVASMRVYRRATHGYAVRTEYQTYEEDILGPERFFEQRGVDYAFTQPPDTIEMSSNSSRVKKVAFNPADDIPLLRYAVMQMQNGKNDDAKKVMARAVANAPCDEGTRRTEVLLVSMMDSADAASATAHRWIDDCKAEDNLEAHRMYQDLNTRRGRGDAMREEYRALLAAAPDSGKLHYLYGRVSVDPRVVLEEHAAAIRLDPTLIWPHVALGHELQGDERFDEALREFETALDMPGHDDSVAVYYATAAIGKGTPEAAVQRIDALRKADASTPPVTMARWMLAAAMSDWDIAAVTQKDLAEVDGADGAWWRQWKVTRLKGDEVAITEAIESASRDKELSVVAQRARIDHALTKGDYRAAAQAVANAKDLDPMSTAIEQAYVAGGLMITGDTLAATQLLNDAEARLAANPDGEGQRMIRAVVGGLKGTTAVADVMLIARENNATQHGWFVTGVRAAMANDRARARDAFRHAVRASSDLDFPYLEVKRMASLFP